MNNFRDWIVYYCTQFPMSHITRDELDELGITYEEYSNTYWDQCWEAFWDQADSLIYAPYIPRILITTVNGEVVDEISK